jgi:amino acid adenylation domain-containing protein
MDSGVHLPVCCVHQAFEQQARQTPERTAVIAGSVRLSYRALELRAGGIAERLRLQGIGPGALVGVCVDRDDWLVPALLGVLKAGAAYVPLDTAYPVERLRFIAEDAGLALIVASGEVDLPVPTMPVAGPDAECSVPARLSDGAYVIYTSGSTGTPKGVLIEHRNLLNLLGWMTSTFSAAELSGMLAASSVCFDASILEIFPPLVSGGTVILAPNLLEMPAVDELTMLFGVPSALAALLRDPLPASVRTVLTGGEVVTRALCDRIFANPGVRRVLNLYGPTECTVICAGTEVAREDRSEPPIGRAIAGAQLSVRDASGAPVADGELGELWVSGPVVARGYLNRPAFSGYRTGDLVRRRGEVLHFAGRADDQVKVRGFRIEPGEVEAALAAHPGVRHAVVSVAGARLVGYVESDTVTGAELRAWLGTRLPAHLVPSHIVVLQRIPLGPGGKVDRAALPAVPRGRDSGVEYTAPRNEIERRVAGVIGEVLGIEEVGVHDRFADLGGHSLAAARVVRELGVPLAVFLGDPTVAGLASAVGSGLAAPGLRRRAGGRYPLTATQREFWLLRQLHPDCPVTTVAVSVAVRGPVTAAAISAGLTGIVRRHEVLRGRVVEDGEPMLEVCPVRPVPVDEISPAGRAAAAGHVFDVSAGLPLIRASLIRHGQDSAELIVVADHTAFDGGSIGPLLRELAAELAGETVAAPAFQFGELDLAERDGSYWRTELAGATIPDDLPGHANESGVDSARVAVPLDPDLLAQLEKFAAESGATPFAVYLAALGLVTGGLTGRADVVLGAPAARRYLPGTQDLIGPLLDVLPLRLRMDAASTFRSLVRDCARTTNDALAHQEFTALPHLPSHRDAGGSRTPVLLAMQEPVSVRCGQFALELLSDLGSGAAPNELTVFVDGSRLRVEHACARFSQADAASFAARMVAALRAGLAAPDSILSIVDLATAEEAATVLEWAAGPALPDRLPTVPEAVLAAARRNPSAIAVTGPEATLTYTELDSWSARVAAWLVASGVRPGDLVGVCLPRDHLLPAVLLGVWRAGAAYLPMDPEHPAERLAWLASDAGVRMVIDQVGPEPAASVPLPGPDPGRLAYVLYTSGSTGVPKAVEVSHANLAASLAGMPIGPDDVMTAVAPLSFDVSAGEIWGPLAVGARCVVLERECATDGYALANRIGGATIIDLTPTSFRMLLAAGWAGDPALRVLVGGETLDPTLAATLLARVKELWNCYGLTETTITSTMHLVSAGDSTVPIGRPMLGERCYVMDPLGRLVPPGVVGELWIGGAGVASGYRGRPELTRAAFVADPFVPGGRCYRTGDLARWVDGRLEFLGRRDDQVKIRGYRVELAEVQAVLRAAPGVADAAVAVAEGTHLVGYLVPADAPTGEVQRFAAGRLPDYLVPRRWVTLDTLPVLANGKLDRAALPEPVSAGTLAPSGDAEELIAAVWAEVLGREQVWADDDFFALGGHSLAATRVIGRLREALRMAIPVRLLFEAPVLTDFAAALESLLLDQLQGNTA